MAMRFERRMSDTDALMWSIEKDPLLRSTITAVALLDRSPDPARLREKLERGSRNIPRLRQRVVSAPFRLAPPEWSIDPNFDLGYHLRWLRSGGTGSLRDLLDLAAPLAMQGFDRARPLWEFTVVEGLADGRAALIQKVHHSLTDGVGGIKLALMLLDTEADPAADPLPMPEAPEPEHPGPLGLLADAARYQQGRRLGAAGRAVGQAGRVLRDPVGVAAEVGRAAASAARMLAPAFEPLSPAMARRSLSVRFDPLATSLPDMKRAAKAAGGKMNDAFVAAVAGGLRRYHERRGLACEAVRMGMPINIRAADAEEVAGNQFVPARFRLPLTEPDPVERMRTIRALVHEQRAEPALAFSEPIAGILNRLPTALVTQLFGGMLKGVDVITSNVPGVPFPVYLAGARVEANLAFGPLSGAAVNITLLSYVDDVHLGINTDPAAVPDPDVFVECLQEGIDEVVKAG